MRGIALWKKNRVTASSQGRRTKEGRWEYERREKYRTERGKPRGDFMHEGKNRFFNASKQKKKKTNKTTPNTNPLKREGIIRAVIKRGERRDKCELFGLNTAEGKFRKYTQRGDLKHVGGYWGKSDEEFTRYVKQKRQPGESRQVLGRIRKKFPLRTKFVEEGRQDAIKMRVKMGKK